MLNSQVIKLNWFFRQRDEFNSIVPRTKVDLNKIAENKMFQIFLGAKILF